MGVESALIRTAAKPFTTTMMKEISVANAIEHRTVGSRATETQVPVQEMQGCRNW
ncbi:MAG: hypothetical protein ABFD89_24250 [Bryobacteraceae bacterium]